MDRLRNPFSPGAGSPPPELVGRDGVLEQASVLLGRIRQKRPEKSLLLTGLRGVGKTVLLSPFKCGNCSVPQYPVLVQHRVARRVTATCEPSQCSPHYFSA